MDEQLYMLGFGLSLEEKVQKAIANFQAYEHEALKRDPVNGYYLCDSYGKDSCVILDLAKRSGVKFAAHHNLTTLDAPELIQFGRKNHFDTIEHHPPMNMLTRLAISVQGPPTRINRWCCEEYKEHGGNDLVRVTGVRAAESARRKANWKIWQLRRDNVSWMLNPILYWSDDNIWQYIKDQKLPYCCLYDQGWERLGCIGCPMSRRGRERDFAKWPKYEQAWKRAITRNWELLHDKPTNRGLARASAQFKSGEEMWSWWMEEMPKDNDECQMGLF